MNRHLQLPAWQFAAAIVCLHLTAEAIADVLPDDDLGPLTGIFGFPVSTEGGRITERGRTRWDTALLVASHNIDQVGGAEELRFDGETLRTEFVYRYGVSSKFDIGIEIPYVSYRGGSLDSSIDAWHEFFGLPEGPRATRQQDQLDLFYTDGAATPINISSRTSGIGDIRLIAGWQLSESGGRNTALRFGVKLPTGDGESLLGSGGTDISVGVASDFAAIWGSENLSGFYRANVTYLGKPDQLADRYKDLVGQLSFGLGYQAWQRVELNAQSRIRSAVYDSNLENLGSTSVSLTFGANIHVSDHYRLGLSLGEDLRSNSAPDVTFQIVLRYVGR